MTVTAHPLRQKYTRSHIKRTTTCPCCGIGTVSQAILRAIDELNLDLDDLVRKACDWVGNYLQNNPNVSEADRRLCT